MNQVRNAISKVKVIFIPELLSRHLLLLEARKRDLDFQEMTTVILTKCFSPELKRGEKSFLKLT